MNLDRRGEVGARRNIGRKSRGRNQRGFHLVETLVALVVGAGIAFSLTSLLSQSMRQSSATQNEVLANQMAFGLLDFLRKQDYEMLEGLEGASPTLLVNRTAAGQFGQAPREDPTLLDFVEKKWSQEAQNNKFNGEVKLKFEAGPISDSVRAIVAISWKSSQSGGERTIVVGTVITKGGAREWQQ